MGKKIFGVLVLLSLVGFSLGCGSSGSTSGGGNNNVTWGAATDGSGTAITSGSSTASRTITMAGTIATSGTNASGLGTAAPISSATLFNNNVAIASLTLTQVNSTTYSYQITFELSPGVNNISVRNTTSDNVQHTSNNFTVTCTAAQVDVHVELSWDKNGTDVDLHLLKPGGVFNANPSTDSSDCGYSNKTPDWNGNGIRNTDHGGTINDVQDPALDVDNVTGFGPENMVVQTPPNGIYTVDIYYYSDHGYGTTNATVKVWIKGTLVKTYTSPAAMVGSGTHSLWTPCTVSVASGVYTVTDVGTMNSTAATRQEK